MSVTHTSRCCFSSSSSFSRPTETRYTPFAAAPSGARTFTTLSVSSFGRHRTRIFVSAASSASSAVFSLSMFVRQ